jgi:hypothetical protein
MAEEDQEQRALVGESADLGRNGHDRSSSKFKVQSEDLVEEVAALS